MKKYRLKKDLPGIKAGAICYRTNGFFGDSNDPSYCVTNSHFYDKITFDWKVINNNPDWFEEVKKEKTFEEKLYNTLLQQIDYPIQKNFVEDNYHWLEKWFDDAENYFDNKERPEDMFQQLIGMQLFSRTYMFRVNDPNARLKQKIRAIQSHKKEILAHAIFGKLQRGTYSRGIGCGGDYPKWGMSGFLEQTGRLPNENDKVKFIYYGIDGYGVRFLRILSDKEDIAFEILSDCKIKILTTIKE